MTSHQPRRSESVVSFAEARDLVSKHRSPLLVLSRSKLAQSYRTIRDHLPGVGIYYAAKANAHALVLETLQSLGASIDVCSIKEMQGAFDAGFIPSQMIHTHPCKTESNLSTCYENGVRWFVFDNEFELDKFVTFAPESNLLLRVSMTSRSSALNLSSKFGASPNQSLAMLSAARRKGLRPHGLSFHIGSQCLDPSDFGHALRSMRGLINEAIAAGIPLEVLDIGGGFPAPYRDQELMPMADYLDIVHACLTETFGDLPIRLIAEPGRAVCAESITLISSIVGKSFREGTRWYFLDDGLYGAFSGKRPGHTDYQLLVERQGQLDQERFDCVIAGPTCDSGDVLYRDFPLPEMEIGELVLAPTMGAYSLASACEFNGMAIPQMIAID
jgi:ornithine decarboxylase